MAVEMYAATCRGKSRWVNQDNFFVNGIWKEDRRLAEMDCTRLCREKKQFFLVCDGMGGEARGDQASWETARLLSERWRGISFFGGFSRFFQRFVREANRRVLALTDGQGRSAGAVFSLLMLQGNQAYVCSIGDCRIYHFYGGVLERLTEDHTMAGMAAGRYSAGADPAGACFAGGYSAGANSTGIHSAGANSAGTYSAVGNQPRGKAWGSNVLLQYLGMPEQEMRLSPCLKEGISVSNGDMFLLCSDGLTGILSEEKLYRRLEENSSLPEKGRLLIKDAQENGGGDDITLILCRVII